MGDFDESGVAEVTHGDIGDAGLSESEEGSRTANLEVFLGEEKAVVAFNESVKTVVGAVFSRKEEAIGLVCPASDASAKLMELGESESVGVFDNHDSGIWHVDAHLDNGGRNEDMQSSFFEVTHNVFFVGGFHFSVE